MTKRITLAVLLCVSSFPAISLLLTGCLQDAGDAVGTYMADEMVSACEPVEALSSAVRLYHETHGRWPRTLQDLRDLAGGLSPPADLRRVTKAEFCPGSDGSLLCTFEMTSSTTSQSTAGLHPTPTKVRGSITIRCRAPGKPGEQ
jgi:hypothetical protein